MRCALQLQIDELQRTLGPFQSPALNTVCHQFSNGFMVYIVVVLYSLFADFL